MINSFHFSQTQKAASQHKRLPNQKYIYSKITSIAKKQEVIIIFKAYPLKIATPKFRIKKIHRLHSLNIIKFPAPKMRVKQEPQKGHSCRFQFDSP